MSKNMNTNWEQYGTSINSRVQSKESITNLSSSLSEFTLRSGDENDWVIKNRYGGNNEFDPKLVIDFDENISDFDVYLMIG